MHSENSKFVICLDSFSKQIYIIWLISDLYQSLSDCLVKFANLLYFPLAFLPDLIGSLMRLL